MTDTTIVKLFFYDAKQENGIYSNFYQPQNLVIDGETWLTTEAYFQAMKFRGTNSTPRHIEYSNLIKDADTPYKVFLLGRGKHGNYPLSLSRTDARKVNDLVDEYKDVNHLIDPDWSRSSLFVMKKALFNKFTSDPDLYRQITSVPDNTYFVEHTPRDRVWADGGDGGTGSVGTNYLGKLLTGLSYILKYQTTTNMSSHLKTMIAIDDAVDF